MFVRGAQRFVVAESAAEAGLRRENSLARIRSATSAIFCCVCFSALASRVVATRFVGHQIVENQAGRVEIEDFARRQRVNAELQILRRRFRVLRLSGFVIDDFDRVFRRCD